mmetsp:Transcript_78935/g.211891  ORF Transcript_78935/g.211891 Transcript_78935/m.211891 type:complete len:295 (+) Transcript_78935:410-1294(+)
MRLVRGIAPSESIPSSPALKSVCVPGARRNWICCMHARASSTMSSTSKVSTVVLVMQARICCRSSTEYILGSALRGTPPSKNLHSRSNDASKSMTLRKAFCSAWALNFLVLPLKAKERSCASMSWSSSSKSRASSSESMAKHCSSMVSPRSYSSVAAGASSADDACRNSFWKSSPSSECLRMPLVGMELRMGSSTVRNSSKKPSTDCLVRCRNLRESDISSRNSSSEEQMPRHASNVVRLSCCDRRVGTCLSYPFSMRRLIRLRMSSIGIFSIAAIKSAPFCVPCSVPSRPPQL